MNDTVTRLLASIADGSERVALRNILNAIADRLSSKQLTSASLTGAGVATPSTGASSYALAGGVLRNIANSQAMAALSGTVTNAKFNVYAYFVDQGGALTSAMGVEGATLAAVKFPPIPEQKAVIGFTIINPTGTGNFVGGTTLFNDATVVPNAVHVNVIGGFDPTILI